MEQRHGKVEPKRDLVIGLIVQVTGRKRQVRILQRDRRAQLLLRDLVLRERAPYVEAVHESIVARCRNVGGRERRQHRERRGFERRQLGRSHADRGRELGPCGRQRGAVLSESAAGFVRGLQRGKPLGCGARAEPQACLDPGQKALAQRVFVGVERHQLATQGEIEPRAPNFRAGTPQRFAELPLGRGFARERALTADLAFAAELERHRQRRADDPRIRRAGVGDFLVGKVDRGVRSLRLDAGRGTHGADLGASRREIRAQQPRRERQLIERPRVVGRCSNAARSQRVTNRGIRERPRREAHGVRGGVDRRQRHVLASRAAQGEHRAAREPAHRGRFGTMSGVGK